MTNRKTDTKDMQAVIEIARESLTADKRHLVYEGIPLTVDSEGTLEVNDNLLNTIDERQPMPPRRTGRSTHTELGSFINHVMLMKLPDSTIWADVNRSTFTAIYNYEGGGAKGKAGWRDYRAAYTCPLAQEWVAWLGKRDTWMSQDQFADWIDLRMEDLVESEGMPMPITIMEMARNLQIFTTGTHTRKVDRVTGQHSLVAKEEHTSESTHIPRAFMTALRIFEGGHQYRVEIRLRFLMKDGQARFMFSVHRHEELKRDAFGEMKEAIAGATALPMFSGSAS